MVKNTEAYTFDDSDIPIKDEDLVWHVIDDDDYGSEDIFMLCGSSESESEVVAEDEELIGGVLMIYPGLDLDHYTYRHVHVYELSKRAIANYNLNTGHSYQFVELVKAFATRDFPPDLVTTIFKAREPHGLSITSFKAHTYVPGRSLSDPNLDIKVVPLHSESASAVSSTYGSELQFEDSARKTGMLETRVRKLQISS